MPTQNKTEIKALPAPERPVRHCIEWAKISRFEFELIEKIVQRALPVYAELGIPDSPLTISMDIAGAHIDCPLALDELLDCDIRDFNHDVLGIRRHFNRRTFYLEGCFLPRYAIN